MKIKMLRTHADPSGTHIEGKAYLVDNKLGEALVNAGAAVNLDLPEITSPKETDVRIDDLTQINGISDKVAEALIAAGIDSFELLSVCTEEDLKGIIQEANLARNARNADTWAEQAKALVAED